MTNLKTIALSLCFFAAACGGQDPADGEVDDLSVASAPHVLPWGDGEPGTKAAAAHLDYYGGRVLGNAEVIAVMWGAGVNAEVKAGMGDFYSAAIKSTYFDWLSEYDTDVTAMNGKPGTGQKIARGSFADTVTITPKNKAKMLTDRAIEKELSAQLTAGKLPKAGPDTVYMVSFPPGVQIDLGGTRSCQSGGFCAYHSAFKKAGKSVAYAVLPDFSPGSGCDTGCGKAARQFDNQTAVASHELVEAVTDADVGLAGSKLGPPLAWYDKQSGEIGDICNGKQGKLKSKSGKSYAVQKEWSNKAKACVVSRGSGGAADEAQEE